MNIETNDFLIALNLKLEIVLLPLTLRTEHFNGGKRDYYETTLKERVFLLGYTFDKIFVPPVANEFSPIEQYFYKIGGMDTTFVKQKYYREDTEKIKILVRQSVSGVGSSNVPT